MIKLNWLSLFVCILLWATSLSALPLSTSQKLAEELSYLSSNSLYELEKEELTKILSNYLSNHSQIQAIEIFDKLENLVFIRIYRNNNNYVSVKEIPDSIRSAKMIETNIYYEKEWIGLVKLYLSENAKAVHFSKKEQAWLQTKEIIRYSEVNWKPMSIIENNKMTGIMGDYMDIIRDNSDIQFEFIPAKSWPEVIEKFRRGEIDLIPGMGDSDKEKELGVLSDSYATYPMVMITNEKITYIKSLNHVKDKTFAIPKFYTSYNYIKKQYPGIKIIETSNIPEALQLVANKEADIFVGHVGPAVYYINKIGAENLKIAGNTDFKFNHHFLINENLPHLVSIVNKIFSTISEKQRESIYSDWIHTEIKQTFNYGLVRKVAIAVIGIILFFIFTNHQLKKQVNLKTTELRELNKNLEVKVQQRTSDLEKAKDEIEESHQHTQESITFASLTQHALLPEESDLKDYFSDFMTVWKPKDVVGGDIFFFEKLRHDEECILFIIDCTGHGVPGAFVSMLVKAIERQVISDIIKDSKDISPAEILSTFNKNMKYLLKQDSQDSISNVGFDGGILYYNKKQQLLRYSGAQTPLFIIKNNEFNMIKSDRHSIGYKNSSIDFQFNDHEIKTEAGMKLYLTTDGFLDQNGGEKGFPFGKKKFKKLICDHHQLSMSQQKEVFINELINFQKEENRNDDITLLGLTI